MRVGSSALSRVGVSMVLVFQLPVLRAAPRRTRWELSQTTRSCRIRAASMVSLPWMIRSRYCEAHGCSPVVAQTHGRRITLWFGSSIRARIPGGTSGTMARRASGQSMQMKYGTLEQTARTSFCTASMSARATPTSPVSLGRVHGTRRLATCRRHSQIGRASCRERV